MHLKITQQKQNYLPTRYPTSVANNGEIQKQSS